MAFFTTIPLESQAQINASETPDWVQRLKKKGLNEFNHSDLSPTKQPLIFQGKQWNATTQKWEWVKTDSDSLYANVPDLDSTGFAVGAKLRAHPSNNWFGDSTGFSNHFGLSLNYAMHYSSIAQYNSPVSFFNQTPYRMSLGYIRGANLYLHAIGNYSYNRAVVEMKSINKANSVNGSNTISFFRGHGDVEDTYEDLPVDYSIGRIDIQFASSAFNRKTFEGLDFKTTEAHNGNSNYPVHFELNSILPNTTEKHNTLHSTEQGKWSGEAYEGYDYAKLENGVLEPKTNISYVAIPSPTVAPTSSTDMSGALADIPIGWTGTATIAGVECLIKKVNATTWGKINYATTW